MERELWSVIHPVIGEVARSRRANAYHTHSHALVVGVYFWAVLHDRPVSWACEPRHWDARTRPSHLPSQSTMSRRLRTPMVCRFLQAIARRLSRCKDVPLNLVKMLDGKPLLVSAHSQDRQAPWGPTGGRLSRGYKLHAIWAGKNMPECWQVRPLNENEKNVAAELIPQLTGSGYLLADGFYHANHLFHVADQSQHQLLAPRTYPHTTIRQPRRFDPARLRCVARLEADRYTSSFGQELFAQRRQIETRFANLCSFGGGLTHLPPWVRGLSCVQRYVHAKLILNAARIKRIHA